MGLPKKEKKEIRKLKILILDQGRQSLPFLKSFHQSGHKAICICNTRLSECYFSRYPSKRLIWPSYVTDRLAFERELINYISEHKIDVTISVGDISSEILSRNRETLLKHTHLTVPDYTTFIKASDKWTLMEYCMANSLPCPKTYKLDDEFFLGNHEFLKFPVIVKPTRGLGAVGVVRFDNMYELGKKYKWLKARYGELIIQEHIPQEGGMQYQAEAFSDKSGKVKVCMVIKKPRFFPVSGGTSTANVTIQHPEIENTTIRLLDGLGWMGAADVDFILDPRDNVAKILEINPRVTAGIKIGFAAGIDYADLHLKLALGEQIPEINTYKLGTYCRNFFLEVLWFLYSDSRMKRNTQPSFFKFFGRDVYDQVISLDDPLAGLGFFLNMIRKYSSISHLKSKFHK